MLGGGGGNVTGGLGGGTVWRERVVLPVHRYRMFRLAGGSRDVFPAINGGAGVGHGGIFSLISGVHASRCAY